jgi:putative membrane protein
MIAALKALHIAALAVWCAGLVALPVVMHLQGRRGALATQPGFARFRLVAHRSYTRVVTPAAVIAVAAGSALILVLRLVDGWMLAKLVLVSGMVLVHAWLGHLIALSGERDPRLWQMPPPLIGLALGLPLMAGVLWLVLAKPDLAGLVDRLPEGLRRPQGRSLPEPVAPI